MGGTPHWRRGHLEWLQATARTTAAERERCAAIVESWKAAPTHDWRRAIGTALKAGYRWLDVYCAGCRQVKPIDLATVDVHPQAESRPIQTAGNRKARFDKPGSSFHLAHDPDLATTGRRRLPSG
jgi:hypothetical protein